MPGKLRPLNLKARHIVRDATTARGLGFSECSTMFAPGWEVGPYGDPDPCPWKHDLELCWSTCMWTGQVPDMLHYPGWLGACANINLDWRSLCTIPDH